jgi:hypothetical protein
MTIVTLQQGVRPGKRESILVILDLLERNLPALDGVATLTIRTKLPAMNVGVAIGAV